MTIEQVDLSPIAGLTFVQGKGDGKKTACIMSAVSILRGLDFNDAPVCVAPEIRSLAIVGNDATWWKDDMERTEVLMPIVPLLLGTAATNRAVTERRLQVIVLAAVRIFAPLALDAVKLPGEAGKLRALPDGADYETLVDAAESAARAAKAAEAAESAARAAKAAEAAEAAAWAAKAAAWAAKAAAWAARAAGAAESAARAAKAAEAAAWAAKAAEAAEAAELPVRAAWLQLLKDVCAIKQSA